MNTVSRLGLASLALLAVPLLVLLLVLPLLSLVLSTTPAEVETALRHPQFLPSLVLSLETTLASLSFIVLSGTPVAWWLARSPSRAVRWLSLLVSLPIVVPPAVLGVALLRTFGTTGLLGPLLSRWDLVIPFSQTAVVLAQIVVAAPFFIQAGANAFRKVDSDMLVVARTLGASPLEAFLRVALPVALPGLLVGATLAWARSLGEFGATLLFAGNMVGTTQTMPLSIYSVLESDVRLAVVFSLVLVAMAAGLLVSLRSVVGPLKPEAMTATDLR